MKTEYKNKLKQETIRVFLIIGVITAMSFAMVSCSSDGVTEEYGEAVLSVDLTGISYEQEEEGNNDNQQGVSDGRQTILSQPAVLAFNKEYSLVAKLSVDTTSTATVNKKISLKSSSLKAATTTVTSPLTSGVQYRIVVYDESGNYVTDKVYTVGTTTSETLSLMSATLYTFICYSINSTSVPDIDSQKNLSEVSLSSLSGSADFTYCKVVKSLSKGNNTLPIVLKHMFSQITTMIDASAFGTITACQATIGGHYSTVNVKLTDASITYNGTVTTTPVQFSSLGTTSITSVPTIISHPETTAGVLTISTMTAGGVVRSDMSVENVKIKPGVRYNLNLTLEKNGISMGGYTWAPANLVYNGGSYGFAANQGVYGDHWQANALLPINQGTGSVGGQTYDLAKDPCAKVTTYGGNWRTPTMAQLQSITGSYAGEKPIFHVNYTPTTTRASYNGVGGLFLGTTSQPATADLDNYIFLPYAGEGGWDQVVNNQGNMGTYWTNTPNGGANIERFQFNTGSITWPYSSQYHVYGGSIRCVKAQ
ncbi:hypothetical protein [Sphingobacterium sp. LRF_L2]|uniref:hypothetical protein n=1 Tax=Sphingobacterium sp. LRF_L2 TaxID=3369421 RepID=UPI003F63AFD6